MFNEYLTLLFYEYFTIIIETILPPTKEGWRVPPREGVAKVEHGAFSGEKDKYTRSSGAGPLFRSPVLVLETILRDQKRSARAPEERRLPARQTRCFSGKKVKYTRKSGAGPLFDSPSAAAFCG
jgi:hypothetical protein